VAGQSFPVNPAQNVIAELEGLRANDIDWRHGRAFSLTYLATPEALELSEAAYRMYAGENALNVAAFPSLRRMQSEILAFVSGLFHAPAGSAGFFTSGGTESLLMVSYASARRRPDVEHPNIVLPTSAHAAFEKACAYFGIESRRVPVRGDWRADAAAMRDAADESTVLFVASAPQYPQGVVDPIAEIGEVASSLGVPLHVDSCIGGMVLAFLEPFCGDEAPFDFRVAGVTSMSVDLHKYGYAAKGSGVIVYRSRELRDHQVFTTDNWLGGMYGSSGVLGTKSGGPIASSWAMMKHFGRDGYAALAASTRATTLLLAEAISAIPPLFVMTKPDSTLICFGSSDPDVPAHAVADALAARGWWVDRQSPPPTLHMTVSAHHAAVVDDFIEALRASVEDVRRLATTDTRPGAYGTVE
jgi:glutamate/tyrosine decarboxylase-like PLP-dependent enzyme